MPQDQDVNQILVAANLSRMRKQWKEAADACIEALVAEPGNVPAHILLGDIYRERDLLDDAIQWYCLALDLDAHSSIARKKLAEAIELRKLLIAPSTPKVGIEMFKGILNIKRDKLGHTLHENSPIALKIAIFIISVIVFSAIVLWPGNGARDKNTGIGETSHNIGAPPFFLQPLGQPKQDPQSDNAKPAAAGEPGDMSLLTALQASPALLTQHITPLAVLTDPRSGAQTSITFEISNTQGAAPTKTQMLRDALVLVRTAQAASTAWKPRSSFARSLLPTGSQC